MSSWSFDDTIAAIATARGPSAIAVIRISGRATREVLSAVAPAGEIERITPRTAKLLTISHPLSGDNIDRALVTWFPGPGSYTGEDAAEISTHGGPLVPALTLEAVIAAGAREALPGEFTRRALLNGKLDLLEAEAVLDLIEGTSPALHRNAIHQLEGGLSERVNEIRSGIVELAALVSYGIDFPDEDEPPVPTGLIVARAEEWLRKLEGLLETAPQGELLREGALVVLAGRPNSGKSSLFNALCGRDRALVTDVPGTTRDAIEVMIPIDGFPFKLVDTAGLRETEDAVESLGIEVARRYVAGADVVLFCVESGRQPGQAEMSFVSSLSQPVVLVRTKADLDSVRVSDGEVRVSVRSGEGLERLREVLRALVFSGLDISPDQPVVTRERHVRALEAAAAEIRSFIELLRDDAPAEVAAVHLSGATDQLEQLVGRVDQEDILDALFASFCVGK